MKHRIKKQFWLSPQDARELKRKAKLCGITETAVIRILLRGYEPKEKPDARFYEAMRQLSAIGNNINQLALKANALGFVDTPMLKNEAVRCHKFQADIEAVLLRPGAEQSKMAVRRETE
ncbi:Bacterial mobilisation protein (MobC) [uncultured Ruminococcus sp.]|nr:Bacterial mobilisation protein (MobC) [uncultured Clostridium sp.]SCI01312.1 Bacterial mobilisation protein (MobC) [uncultured Ruminococcus sp.]